MAISIGCPEKCSLFSIILKKSIDTRPTANENLYSFAHFEYHFEYFLIVIQKGKNIFESFQSYGHLATLLKCINHCYHVTDLGLHVMGTFQYSLSKTKKRWFWSRWRFSHQGTKCKLRISGNVKLSNMYGVIFSLFFFLGSFSFWEVWDINCHDSSLFLRNITLWIRAGSNISSWNCL